MDEQLRTLLDPSQGAVTLGHWRAITFAGENRLAYLSASRAPGREPLFEVTVYREPIPFVNRLTKSGALKLVEAMRDQTVWEARSAVSHANALAHLAASLE